MLTDVVDLLVCPQCRVREVESGLGLGETDRSLWCDRGHSFDVARQGYVSLLTGDGGKFTGDSAEMVTAREKFLGAGHFEPIAAAVSAAVPPESDVVLDVGVGTGYYLAGVLDARPAALGSGGRVQVRGTPSRAVASAARVRRRGHLERATDSGGCRVCGDVCVLAAQCR